MPVASTISRSFTRWSFNLLAAGKFQYKSNSYKMQNLCIKSLDISGRVSEPTAGRYIDQPRRQRKVQCKKFVSFVMKVWEGISM